MHKLNAADTIKAHGLILKIAPDDPATQGAFWADIMAVRVTIEDLRRLAGVTPNVSEQELPAAGHELTDGVVSTHAGPTEEEKEAQQGIDTCDLIGK